MSAEIIQLARRRRLKEVLAPDAADARTGAFYSRADRGATRSPDDEPTPPRAA